MPETSAAAERRTIRFENLQQIGADVDSLAAAPSHRTIGNWSLGQILWHLAKVMNDSIDGTTIRWSNPPPAIPEPIKRRVLGGSMRSGFQLPPDAAKELVPPPMSTAEGIALFRAALARQQSESKREPNPFFGPLTPEEWTQLHCRHAELHLSFVIPQPATGK